MGQRQNAGLKVESIMHLIGIDQMKHKTKRLCQYTFKFMPQHQPVFLSIVHTDHPCGEALCDCQSACNTSYSIANVPENS